MENYHFVDILVNLVLAVIMFGLGLSLTFDDFKRIVVNPRAILTCLTTQLFIIPVIAFGIAIVSGLTPEEKVGIVLVSACASGASSNLINHLLRGNVALAISMTTINSFITLLSLPFIVNLALVFFLGKESDITLPIGETIFQIVLITLVPASIGVYIRKASSRFALALEYPLKFILPLLLGLVFTLKIFNNESNGGSGLTYAEGIRIFPFVLALNFLAMAVGYYISRFMKLDFRNRYTIAIEVGLHNTALALLVAGSMLNSPDMEKPALVYALFTFFTPFIFVFLIKGKNLFRDMDGTK